MIDTLSLKTSENIEKEKIYSLIKKNILLTKYSKLELNHNFLCLKPSSKNTSSLKDVIDCISSNNINGKISRLDIAFDLEETFVDNNKLFIFFIFSLRFALDNKINKKNVLIFKDINKELNFKTTIKNNNFEITIYDCSDKNDRDGNTRIEFRILNIKNSNFTNEEIILNSIKQYNNYLKFIKENSEDIIKKIENLMLEILKTSLSNEKKDKFNKTMFIKKNSIYFLTRNIFIEFFKYSFQESTKTSNINNFLKNYRRKYKLNFIKKKQLIDLIEKIIEENNKTIN